MAPTVTSQRMLFKNTPRGGPQNVPKKYQGVVEEKVRLQFIISVLISFR